MPRLFLLDAMALIYRAHFAFIKTPRFTSYGFNTSAILGFTSTLVDVLRKEKPEYISVAFDTPEPTFRHKQFADYKANRPSQPEDINSAIPWIKKILHAFNIPIIECPGYEADDIIGTIVNQVGPQHVGLQEMEIYMMSLDKDFAQLVTDRVFLYRPSLGGRGAVVQGPEEVHAGWGVRRADQIRDILGLQGDAVDNIPGIPGIGSKTAQRLISEFGTIEQLIANSNQLKGRLRERVELYGKQGIASKQLATICTQVPLEISIESMRYIGPDPSRLQPLLEKLEFRSLSQRIANMSQGAPGEPSNINIKANKPSWSTLSFRHHIVDSPNLSKELAQYLMKCDKLGIYGLTDFKDGHYILRGLAFARTPQEAYYLPIPEEDQAFEQLLGPLYQVLTGPSCKVGYNLKPLMRVLQRRGFNLSYPYYDILIAHSLCKHDRRHDLLSIFEHYLGYAQGQSLPDLPQGDCELSAQIQYTGTVARHCIALYDPLKKVLTESSLDNVLVSTELPLVSVLACMENSGVKVDTSCLHRIEIENEKLLVSLGQKIYEAAGATFNISSPKQLGEILFDRLRLLENPGYTKTGQYATGEEVLQQLRGVHPIIDLVMEYRMLDKLRYFSTLPALVSRQDGRIHTSYNQAVTITGRLSSSDPNLQNIPIRTEYGKQIRKAFVARDNNHLLLCADYSQIELRVMAYMSQDQTMIYALQSGEDIHTVTAAKLFGITQDQVTEDQRRRAKTANFGIIYGVSAFGLSRQLDIPLKEARELIADYFEKFPDIKSYMNRVVSLAREAGYVQTHMGRRQWLPDIQSRNAAIRGLAERRAINMIIQGSAAEMIKLAMIKINAWMLSERLRSQMILQVHDELVFDVHVDELSLMKQNIPVMMRNAMPLGSPGGTSYVPLEVHSNTGSNWLEAH